MGSNLREILYNVSYPEIFLYFPNEKEKKKIGSKENAILEFYEHFSCVGGDPVFSESLCKELQKRFFQQRCELGRIGRQNMNQRLNIDILQNDTFLLPRDVLAATDHLTGMKFGMGTLDNMNHLKQKRIHFVADLEAIRHKFIPTPQNLVTSTPLTTTYESFFGLHPLSQVLDRTNPLTQIVHGHYGRICPIDMAEGINVGLIGSLAIHARIANWGSVQSPFNEISDISKEE
ncbi:hypothetical protein AMTRI_Chr08g205040 [Amborella trichopoda]